jgi:hypothetical protein
MVDNFARPTISQTTNQAARENKIGIFFPNRIMAAKPKDWSNGVLE